MFMFFRYSWEAFSLFHLVCKEVLIPLHSTLIRRQVDPKLIADDQQIWGRGSSRRGARPEDGAHPTRLLCRTGFLTLFAKWAGTAMANAGHIQYAQRTVAL